MDEKYFDDYEDFYEMTENVLPPHRALWAEINLENVIYNLSSIRAKAGAKAKIMAVVKADAYGHGFEMIDVLQQEGVDYFCVAFCDEAIAIRQSGIEETPIVLLGNTEADRIPELIDWNIEPAVYQYDFAKALSDYCEKEDTVVKIHIKVDTGMGRIGWRWDEAADAIEKIAQLPGIKVQGMFSHFSVADEIGEDSKEYTRLQLDRFAAVGKALKERGIQIPLKHIENSAAIMTFSKTVFDGVRPGIILYGLYPSAEMDRNKLPLMPVMSLKTKIVHIKTIHAGDAVGYGRKYIAASDRRIATLPVGYADGYTRMLSGKGTEVYVCGKRAPIVGNICMDQCMIDITDVPEAKLFDEVELFGEHIPVEELADRLGTINYELVCMINKRVPRIYTFMGDKFLSNGIIK